MQSFNFPERSMTPAGDQYTDIRCDDEYESFYHASAAQGRRLPPPLNPDSMYSQMQQLPIQQQQLANARLSPAPVNGMLSLSKDS